MWRAQEQDFQTRARRTALNCVEGRHSRACGVHARRRRRQHQTSKTNGYSCSCPQNQPASESSGARNQVPLQKHPACVMSGRLAAAPGPSQRRRHYNRLESRPRMPASSTPHAHSGWRPPQACFGPEECSAARGGAGAAASTGHTHTYSDARGHSSCTLKSIRSTVARLSTSPQNKQEWPNSHLRCCSRRACCSRSP